MTDQRESHPPIDVPGTQLRELTIRVLFDPEKNEIVSQETATYLRRIGALASAEHQITLMDSETYDDTQKDQHTGPDIMRLLDERMFAAGFESLERSVSRLIFMGKERKQIAKILSISMNSVNNSIQAVLQKTGCENRFGVAGYLLGATKGDMEKALVAQCLAEIAAAERDKKAARENVEISLSSHPLITPEEQQTITDIYNRMMDYYGLTKRERQVTALAMSGKTDEQISSELLIKESTVKNHLSSVYDKIHNRKRSHLAIAFLGINELTSEEVGS